MIREASNQALQVADTARSFLGSTKFRHRYRPVRSPSSLMGWRVIDVANDGDDSCASFTSHILAVNGLLRRTRSTVGTMLGAMETYGWFRTTEAAVGGVALWGYRDDITPLEGSEFGHTGVYVGTDQYVSHSSYERVPVLHPPQLRDGRDPTAFYAHDELFVASNARPQES